MMCTRGGGALNRRTNDATHTHHPNANMPVGCSSRVECVQRPGPPFSPFPPCCPTDEGSSQH
eukprot:55791-Chlamydomonas_euryale.AAC.2